MIASVRSALTSGAIRDRVVSSSDRGPRIRQYCFGIGAPEIKWVRLCNRVPSPPARTSAQKDWLDGSAIEIVLLVAGRGGIMRPHAHSRARKMPGAVHSRRRTKGAGP